MNKQELIERIEKMPYDNGILMDFVKLNRRWLLRTIEQLEPEKVIIPQFVADFIAEQKKLGHTLSYSIDACMSDRVAEWYWDNSELFALAWIFGYEVEEEKRYKVVMPNVSSAGGVLTRIKHNNSWIWIDTLGTIVEGRTHTRKELEEADFGRVFDCPGIEIEEVE